MHINPNIFREYDIRGLVETDLTTPVVREIGKGLGTFLKRQGAKRFTVGRDGQTLQRTDRQRSERRACSRPVSKSPTSACAPRRCCISARRICRWTAA